MNIIKDDAAQTSAELVLLFGGVIVIVVVFAVFYSQYIRTGGNLINGTEVQNVVSNISNTSNPQSLINKVS